MWILLSPFSFDLCFSSLSSFLYRSRSLCSSVIILWQISFDHRKSKERCITILAPLPILNDDHLMFFYILPTEVYIQLQMSFRKDDKHDLFNLLHLTVNSTVVWLVGPIRSELDFWQRPQPQLTTKGIRTFIWLVTHLCNSFVMKYRLYLT